jgi:hypothetical protein
MKKAHSYCVDFNEWLPNRPQKQKRERTSVTVCIAATCKAYPTSESEALNLHMVIGAADRMLTGGEMIEFEPHIMSKIVHFSSSISGMFAGDFTMQYELLYSVLPVVTNRIKAEPKNWWSVKEVAELYAKSVNECHIKRAENAILVPMGLDINSFYAKQKGMDSDLVKQLASKLSQFRSPGIEAIFCGMDLTGPHIYVVDNSANVECRDAVGFAAIGVGAWHANSQFMFADHHWNKSLAETLLLIYSAKKHAEVAPGVGEDTDMFAVGPQLGQNVRPMGPQVLEKLEKTYTANRTKKDKIDKQCQLEIGQFIDEIIKKAAANQNQANPSSPTELPPPDAQFGTSGEKKE